MENILAFSREEMSNFQIDGWKDRRDGKQNIVAGFVSRRSEAGNLRQIAVNQRQECLIESFDRSVKGLAGDVIGSVANQDRRGEGWDMIQPIEHPAKNTLIDLLLIVLSRFTTSLTSVHFESKEGFGPDSKEWKRVFLKISSNFSKLEKRKISLSLSMCLRVVVF